MSFSQQVKDELAEHIGRSRHCQIAELAALVVCSGRLQQEKGKPRLCFDTENPVTRKKYFTLLSKTTSIKECKTELEAKETEYVLRMLKMPPEGDDPPRLRTAADGLILQQTCCKRAFLRGAFLAAGSISDPTKGYHFEIVCKSSEQAEQMQQIMRAFELDAKIVRRKGHEVVYLKEGAQIVDILNVMGAHVALMNLENIRILREMRNSVNRKVNCETANISRTVNAAVRQVEDIRWIRDQKGLESLPKNLQEIARVRLENPDMPLKDLGARLDPPIGKSGVNHRLRKISEIARESGGGQIGRSLGNQEEST